MNTNITWQDFKWYHVGNLFAVLIMAFAIHRQIIMHGTGWKIFIVVNFLIGLLNIGVMFWSLKVNRNMRIRADELMTEAMNGKVK